MNSPMGFANKKAGIGEENAEVFPLVLDDRTGHYPQPRGGRDGMSDYAFMWGMWLGRGTAVSNGDNSKKQPRQQQEATETAAGSNREDSRKQRRG